MTSGEILTSMLSRQWKFTVSSTNDYCDLEIPPQTNFAHCLSLIVVSFTGALTTRLGIYVKDGNKFIFKYFTNDNIVIPFSPPLKGTKGNSMLISADPSGDPNITCNVCVLGFDLYS